MAKSTLNARIATWLCAVGAIEAPSKSRRYRRFILNGKVFWLGKAGALRSGPTSTGSVNAAHLVPAEVLATPTFSEASTRFEAKPSPLTLAHLLKRG